MIGDRDDASRIGKNQFEMVDAELGLKQGTMAQRALKVKESLMEEKDALAETVEKEIPACKIVKRIAELIGNRCKNLSRQGLQKPS